MEEIPSGKPKQTSIEKTPAEIIVEGFEIPSHLIDVYRRSVEALDALEQAGKVTLDDGIREGFAEEVAGMNELGEDEVVGFFVSYFNQVVEENNLEGTIDVEDLLRELGFLEPETHEAGPRLEIEE